MVDSTGAIFRRTSPSPTSGYWEQMPGAGNDISVGPFENAFVLGTSSVPGAGPVHLWNEQWGVDDVPDVADWINLFQEGTSIAVGLNGRPWMIGPNHEILTVTK
jgi:hypothetical protein